DHGDEGHGHGKGHEQRESARSVDEVRPDTFFRDEHRDKVHRYYAEHYTDAKRCPPGLAKKNNGCLPPGQARKLAVGEPLPRGAAVYSVPQPVLVQLPPAPYGYRYSRVGPDVVLVVTGN